MAPEYQQLFIKINKLTGITLRQLTEFQIGDSEFCALPGPKGKVKIAKRAYIELVVLAGRLQDQLWRKDEEIEDEKSN